MLKSTIEECWDTEPEARLTALCVVKRMQEIQSIKSDVALSDNVPDYFFDVSARVNDKSIQQGDCAEQINLRELPIVNYRCEAAIPCTCIDNISLKESLIKPIQRDYLPPEEC